MTGLTQERFHYPKKTLYFFVFTKVELQCQQFSNHSQIQIHKNTKLKLNIKVEYHNPLPKEQIKMNVSKTNRTSLLFLSWTLSTILPFIQSIPLSQQTSTLRGLAVDEEHKISHLPAPDPSQMPPNPHKPPPPPHIDEKQKGAPHLPHAFDHVVPPKHPPPSPPKNPPKHSPKPPPHPNSNGDSGGGSGSSGNSGSSGSSGSNDDDDGGSNSYTLPSSKFQKKLFLCLFCHEESKTRK